MAAMSSERRQQVMLGDLPDDFLRVGGQATPQQQQIYADQQAAAMLQAQMSGFSFAQSNMAKLSITVAQAKLSKNYGLTKMDPYCRIRVGHSVFETPTAHNGAKNPRWNKAIQCYIPVGVDAIYLEIFDERAFTMDERIAWVHVRIPEAVFNGETSDEWYTLSGKQGDDKEGMVNIVLSYTPTEPQAVQTGQRPVVYTTGGMVSQPIMVVPQGVVNQGTPVYYPQQVVQGQMPPGQQPQQQQQVIPQGPLYTEEDVKIVKDMFPNVDEEVIKSVLEANSGNKDTTIENLLSMNT